MFVDFLYQLRAHGLKVGTHEWRDFLTALEGGLHGGTIRGLYFLGRALLVKRESGYHAYDAAFADYFEGLGISDALKEALKKWLDRPAEGQGERPPTLLEEDALLEEFRRLLAEQRERHDGGNRFIGTRGTSPFGHSGTNPRGIRVGGRGGQRSAIHIVEAARYEVYRRDVLIDTRRFKVALKSLRRLERHGPDVLQLDPTIKATAESGGDIQLVYGPERKNNIKLLLLMDAGGSMTPHARQVDRLFSAADSISHFKRFEYYFFHNCVYSRLYKDFFQQKSVPTEKVLRDLGNDFRVVLVGDACMAPWELNSGSDFFITGSSSHSSGLDWFRRIRKHFQDAVWLNPEPRHAWNHPTIQQISRIFPMYELTLDGLSEAMKHLRIARRDLK